MRQPDYRFLSDIIPGI